MYVCLIDTLSKRIVAAVVSVLVVVSAVPLPVAAQGGTPESVLLDGGAERVANMEIDGTSYTVFSVKNTVPYAGGVEVYADGRMVTDPAAVEPVLSRLAARRTLDGVDTSVEPSSVTSASAAEEQFTVVAWQVAATRLDGGDVQQLRELRGTADRIDRMVSPPLSAINGVLRLFERMRNTGLLGVSAWDLATSTYPSLPQYEEALRVLRTELTEWNAAAERVERNIDPAVRSLERARQGEPVDYARVSSQLRTASQGFAQLESKSDEVATGLSTSSDGAGEVASQLRESQVPGEFVRPLSQLSDRLGSAATAVDGFSSTLGESRSQLTSVRETARERRQQLVDQWRSERSSLRSQWTARQSAETRVYGTIGGGSVGLFGMALLGRRFR